MTAKPNFIGIGGHKCASTWLSECLRVHPEVFLSDPKEVGYFKFHYSKGLDWYIEHFSNVKNEKVIGEFASDYIYDNECAHRIKQDLGVVKTIAVIREPVGRALSQIKHGIRLGKLPSPQSSKVTIDYLQKCIEIYPYIVERSMYAEGLKRFEEEFGKSNLLVFDQKDFLTSPEVCVSTVYEYLGVDKKFTPYNLKKVTSKGITPKYKALEQFRVYLYSKFRSKRGLIPLIRRSGLADLYRKYNQGVELTFDTNSKHYLDQIFSKDWEQSKTFF